MSGRAPLDAPRRCWPHPSWIGAALLFLCASVTAIAADAPRRATTHTVVIEGVAFVPAVLTVRRGDSVVWVNKDPFPHTATAAGRFDSKAIDPGKTWTHVMSERGEFPYVCALHPTMKATLRVE